MKNWIASKNGDKIFIIRSGDGRRNQSLIRVASVSKKEIVRYRSNRVPVWILEEVLEALDAMKVNYIAYDLYVALGKLKVGERVRL